MTTVAKLSADLVANSSSFSTGLDSADRRLGKSAGLWSRILKNNDQSFVALGSSVTKLAGTFGILSGIVTGVLGSGFVLIAKGAVDAASAIDDTSQRLQISTTELQKFQFAAKLAGIENGQLEGALTKLNAKIADGSLKYKDTTEALFSIADAVKNATSDTERAAIVNDAFGAKMGAKLIPLLTAGADGLRTMGDQAERTGNVISQNTIKNAAAFGDQLDVLGATIKNNFQQGLLDAFVDKSAELKSVYDDPEFANSIRNIGAVIGDVTSSAIEGAGALAGYVIKLENFYEKARNFKFGLSQETFDVLNGKRTADAVPKPGVKVGGDTYGPAAPPQPAKPHVFSSDNKKSENATKQLMKDAEAREKATRSVLDGLRLESEELDIQTSMYGQKESAISRARKELELSNQLAQSGIVLTKEQRKEYDGYLSQIERQTELQNQQEKQAERLKDQEKNRQEALDQLGATLQSSFEDAIVEGEKLSDVMDGLLKDIIKLLLRKNITEPLFNSVMGSGSSGGGLFGSIFGGIASAVGAQFGGSVKSGDITWDQVGKGSVLKSYAVGTDYVPYDMTANIHKGEMIIPAREAAMLRAGGGRSESNVVVNVVNNAGAKVGTSSKNGPSGTELTVMIDQAVADNIARQGSKTNQALSAQSGRTLVRR